MEGANHPFTKKTNMKQIDILQRPISGLQEVVRSLNENTRNRLDQEYHWFADYPYVEAAIGGMDGQVEAKVMAVKYPITEHSGILIMPDEDREYYEVGWTDLLPDDIAIILEALPDEDD